MVKVLLCKPWHGNLEWFVLFGKEINYEESESIKW